MIMNDDTKNEGEMEFVADEESANVDLSGKIQKFRQELLICERDRKEYLDGWQRAKADHINYKKDEAKRLEDTARFIASGFMQDMLPALDSFDLALGHAGSSDIEKGVLLIRSQLLDALKRRGLEVMSADGAVFDPALHESVGEVESDGEEGRVAEVIQKGYFLQGELLRPARVRGSIKKQ